MPRWLTTTIIIAAAFLLGWAFIAANSRPVGEEAADPKGKTAQTATDGAADSADDTPDAAPPDGPPASPDTAEAPADGSAPPPPPTAVDRKPLEPIEGLKVVAVDAKQPEPTIGSTERDEEANPFVFEAKFTPYGGGVKHIRLSRYSTNVEEFDPLPVLHSRDVPRGLGSSDPSYTIYPMAAYSVTVNGGKPVWLYTQRWAAGETRTDENGDVRVSFTITLADGADNPVLRIDRTWRVSPKRYDLRVSNVVTNLTDGPLDVKLDQLGPIDLDSDGGYLGDKRGVLVGYLEPRGERKYVSTSDHEINRVTLIEAESPAIFPTEDDEPGAQLLWAAMTNRYFAVITHGAMEEGSTTINPIDDTIASVRRVSWAPKGYLADPERATLGLVLDGVPVRLAGKGGAGAAASKDLDVYAGPKDPDILKVAPEYKTLRLGDLIIYNLGGMCAFCTFDWLAVGLLNFLKAVHWLVADWGLAIILLVALVRTVLHPLTKRSQVNMMKMSKQMQQLQPEIQRIKDKHGDNKEKLNTEMMQLYRERGVNPAAMGLGCLPMFLQMPIWFALYAMLYFAIELRHEPAFYNVFHKLGEMVGVNWRFLTDLSAQDQFITFPEFSVFGFFTLSSLNLLPILMAAVFYLQQKYTTAATPPANEQMAQQQKIMKFMILLFPIFLYKAPSGLNLYILTSTTVGVIESRRVRAHLKELEESGDLFKKKEPKPGGFMDRLTKMAEAKQREMMEKRGVKPQPGPGPGAGGGGKKKKPRGKGGSRF